MIDIKNKASCCGCTACVNICPEHCIDMRPDFEGFLYPHVNEENCIDCGLCEKVCPELSGYEKNQIQSAYAARHRIDNILDNSTSGGAFTAFAELILEQGGIVFGAGFDDNFKVIHLEVEGNPEGLSFFRGSKYVQSDLGDAFRRIREYLSAGRFVLFSGTPCQICGLKNYIGENSPQLLLVEVICRGVPSPLLWDKYLDYQMMRYHSKPRSISFRKKTYGYHSGTMEIVFENEKRYIGSARIDYMLKSFYSGISSRYSCYTCMCKGKARPADLSIFDCWHSDVMLPRLRDDNRGYTNIFVNTEKGKRAFDKAKYKLKYYSTDIEKIIDWDGIMICQTPPVHPNRGEYFKEMNKDLESAVSTFIPVRNKDRLIEKSKALFYRLGLLRVIKRMKKDN